MAGKGSKKQLTLTQALGQFLGKTLLPDLKERARQTAVHEALTRQWQAEKAANRTADGFLAWEARTLEQVGAAWVLSCVFVRTLEDRDLLARRRLAGAGATDSEQLFFELGPSLTARDYLLTVFKEVASLPGAEELLGPAHNPLWRLAPSAEVARGLLDFFRQTDGAGALLWRFDGVDTRFLGDLYQDLSEDVRKRYALLQTPDFVERFILEQTLDPAIAEFGLEVVRVIDPTCGSGHFLLGAFDRLLNRRLQAAPGVDVRDHAVAALAQVYGVDVNPYAVAIARFRLTLAYLQRTGITKLAQVPRLPLNLVVADSLLHGGSAGTELLLVEQENSAIDRVAWHQTMFALEDEITGRKILRDRYHAVVGNPPYITCKDSVLREVYRERYTSAAGKYRVIQIDAPSTVASFLQRMGRTGRRAETFPNCTFLATKDEMLVQAAALIHLQQEGFVESVPLQTKAAHLLAHQIMALSQQEIGIPASDWWAWVSQAIPFSGLTPADRETVVEHMLSEEILMLADGRYSLGEKGRKLFGAKHFAELYAVFSSPTTLTVMHGPEPVGQIDAFFAHTGDLEKLTFTLGARTWRATHINWARAIVHVEPTEQAGLPRWHGQPMLLSRDLCQAMRAILTGNGEHPSWSQRARKKMQELREQHAFLQAEGDTLEPTVTGHRLWTFAGGKRNNLLAKVLEEQLGSKVTNNNLYLSFTEEAGKSEAAIRAALEALQASNRPNHGDALKFAASCARGILSKFESCLPDTLLNQYQAERLTAVTT